MDAHQVHREDRAESEQGHPRHDSRVCHQVQRRNFFRPVQQQKSKKPAGALVDVNAIFGMRAEKCPKKATLTASAIGSKPEPLE